MAVNMVLTASFVRGVKQCLCCCCPGNVLTLRLTWQSALLTLEALDEPLHIALYLRLSASL